MSEQRLIDANVLLQYMSDMDVQTGKKCCTQAVKSCIEEFFPQVVFDQPTIDPETLPIVQQLRDELENVKAERNAAVSDIETYMAYPNDNCQFCKNASCQSRNGTKPCLPKWRGLHKEE